MPREYYIYIMTKPRKTVLYTGVTNDLSNRVAQHIQPVNRNSFTSRYNICKLVYYEIFDDIETAIEREKQIKAGSRSKKIKLIEKMNPDWKNLSGELL